MPERAFLATRDLVFRAKLAAVIRASGAAVTVDEAGCDIAVVDVEDRAVVERIRTWVANGVPVLAYGPHVRADLLRAARDAGAVAVPNSAAEEKLRELLQTT
jgi:hypothetical protein